MGVPSQCGDPVTACDAGCVKAFGELEGAAAQIPIGLAVDRAFDQAADNLLIAELRGGVVNHLADQQGPMLHETQHGCFPSRIYANPDLGPDLCRQLGMKDSICEWGK